MRCALVLAVRVGRVQIESFHMTVLTGRYHTPEQKKNGSVPELGKILRSRGHSNSLRTEFREYPDS